MKKVLLKLCTYIINLNYEKYKWIIFKKVLSYHKTFPQLCENLTAELK